jgi:hypothetical protein
VEGMSLQHEIISDLQVMEHDLGFPTFTWNGGTYKFIPSITDFNRELETGGFALVKLMTATVRKFDINEDESLNPIFPGGYPQPQRSIIQYSIDGLFYRVESIKHDPTNAYFRLIAHSTTKGI